MIEIERFYNASPDITFDREDLRKQYTMNGLSMLRNSSNIPHKTIFSMRSCQVNEAFLDECFSNLSGNKFIETLIINDILPDLTSWTGPLCSFVRENIRIKTLNIQGSRLSTKDFETLSDAIVSNEVIQNFDISRIKIDKLGVPYIAKIILCNDSISTLTMRSNMIAPEDLLIIASSLPLNKSLRNLSLSDSQITMPVAMAFSAALHKTESVLQLISLDISSTQIDDAILNCLRLGLRKNHNRSLISINLASNNLTDDAIPYIEDIASWPNMREILLNGNTLSALAIESLKSRVQRKDCVIHF